MTTSPPDPRLQPTNSTPPKDTLAGSVERVTFHNEDNGFAVLKVKAAPVVLSDCAYL